MKTHISDVLQIALAVVITGGMVASAAPLPKQAIDNSNQPIAVAKTAQATKSQVASEKASEQPVVQPEASNDPNHCEPAQYWNQQAPYNCIPKPAETVEATVTSSYVGGGSKEQWMAAAGIPQSEWWAVDYIVRSESGWNPCAYNPGQTNCNLTAEEVNATQVGDVACGIGQSLPCGKWGANWTDPVNQLVHQYSYVTAVYGGYAEAVAFWERNHHY